MVIQAIMKKNFLEFYRNKISIVLLILFPLFFLFIFHTAFGNLQIGGVDTYSIALINHDQGIPTELKDTLQPSLTSWVEDGVAANISAIIEQVTYNDSAHTPIFSVKDISADAIDNAIKNEEIAVAVVFPENYSLLVLNQINLAYGNQSIPGYPTAVNATIEFIRDINNPLANIPIAIITQIIDTFHNTILSGDRQGLTIDQQSVVRGEINSVFDYIASGLLVFATVLAAAYFSAQLLADEQGGTMMRIKISDARPIEYVSAFFLQTFLLVMIQQVILLFCAIIIFGFHPVGSLFVGYIILLLSSIPMYALVFSAGSIFRSSDTAGNVIGFSSSIIGFASGIFTEMPSLVLARNVMQFRSGSPDLLLWDLVPWTHAVNAIRVVFLYDQSLIDVAGDLVLLVVTSVIWLAIAMYFYMRNTFRRDY